MQENIDKLRMAQDFYTVVYINFTLFLNVKKYKRKHFQWFFGHIPASVYCTLCFSPVG